MRQDERGYYLLTAGAAEAGRRLDHFLASRFGISRSALRARLDEPPLDEERRPLKWSHRLRPGELVRLRRLERPEPPVEVRYRILYTDDWLVAVDKGPGAPVHPARSFRSRTVLTRLRAELGDPALSPAHRLDRETSGVLIFGRGPQATSALGRQFAAGRVQKAYLAVVRGRPDFETTVVDVPLARDPDFPVRCRMRPAPGGGQPARTELEVLERAADRALVAARPRTGRQHQIRVHLASLGHPILGDKLYQQGGQAYLDLIHDRLPTDWAAQLGHHRLALHAERITFRHPQSGADLTITAPLPADLHALLVGLEDLSAI